QELNVSLKELKPFLEHGPDLSYDFVTRAQMVHALLTRDAGLLRQAYGFLLASEVPCGRLVHDLQNHDEITYQLVELDFRKAELMKTGDYRWINRGGVDLMGANPGAKQSAYGLPRARSLYGPLPEQLKDPDSFVSSLKKVLAARTKYRVAEGALVAAPEPDSP